MGVKLRRVMLHNITPTSAECAEVAAQVHKRTGATGPTPVLWQRKAVELARKIRAKFAEVFRREVSREWGLPLPSKRESPARRAQVVRDRQKKAEDMRDDETARLIQKATGAAMLQVLKANKGPRSLLAVGREIFDAFVQGVEWIPGARQEEVEFD